MAQWALQFTQPSGQTAPVRLDEGTLSTPPEYAGYEFVKYSYTVKHADGTQDAPVEGTAPGSSAFTVDGLESGDEVMVVYTNKPQPEPDTATVSWQKKDDSGAFLGGTVWTLNKTAEPTTTFDIVDNTGQEGYSGRDQNSDAGKFEVMDLAVGEYTLTEKSAPEGYILDDTPYDFTLTAAGLAIDKVFVNKATTGSVTWRKIDDASPANPLGGSVWTITPTSLAGDVMVVEDNTGQSGYVGPDEDKTAGSFYVSGLKWGEYTLVETKAPFGYVLDATERDFTITKEALNVIFRDGFVNTRPDIPVLPLTGGASADIYWIAGGLTVILTVIVGFGVHMYRTYRIKRSTHATAPSDATTTGE
jgi:uncharacterized surface anchored protein